MVQKIKENAMKLAAEKGLGLHRFGKNIVGVDNEEVYYLICQTKNWDNLWSRSLQALKNEQEKKLKLKEKQEIINKNNSSMRDKWRKEAIDLAAKGGLLFFTVATV